MGIFLQLYKFLDKKNTIKVQKVLIYWKYD